MRIKSNRYKCRNLPTNYQVIDSIKTKPISSMIALGVIGLTLIAIDEDISILGFVFIGFSIYFVVFTENKTSIVFSDQFMIVYTDQKTDECLLLYYDEIINYEYQNNGVDVDTIVFELVNNVKYELKSLDKRKMMKNVHKYICANRR